MFDDNCEKLELFGDLLHFMIKMQPETSERMKVTHFHILLRRVAQQTFRNINFINSQTLENVLVIIRRKYNKPGSKATTKHEMHRLVFHPATVKNPDFLK